MKCKKLYYSKNRVAEAMDIRERWYNSEKTERTPFTFTVAPSVHNSVPGNPYNFMEMCMSAEHAVEGHLISFQYQFDTFPNCDFIPLFDLSYMGEGILASMYGAEQYMIKELPPFTKGRVFRDIYEAARLTNDFEVERTEWGAKLKEHIECFIAATDGRIPISIPDYQSPYGTATKLMPNEELMMAMYDEPELVHKFIGTVTEGIIKLVDTVEKWTGPGIIARNVFCPAPGKGGIILYDDYISVLNPKLHTEFCAPYNIKLYERYGYGHLHTCGPIFPSYCEACLACSPRSMDIVIMRGKGKSKEDLLELLSITEPRGIRLFGDIYECEDFISGSPKTKPDRNMLERFVRGGFFPADSGTYEEGLAFQKLIKEFDETIRG